MGGLYVAMEIPSLVMGIYPHRIDFSDGTTQNVIVKIKPLDSEVLLTMAQFAFSYHPDVLQQFERCKHLLKPDRQAQSGVP